MPEYKCSEENSFMLSKLELQERLKHQYGINKNISAALSEEDCDQILRTLEETPEAVALVTSYTQKLQDLGRSNRLFGQRFSQLQAELRNDPIAALSETFNFPEEVRVACMQYLLYFTEFLKEIGIEASSKLLEEKDSVIFIVQPKSKEEALEKLRELLGIYLKLPSQLSRSIPPVSLKTDIAVQRLTAQILHLQSQLSLANAIIESKKTHIEQQQQIIQNLTFTPKILLDAMEEDKEPLLGGLVAIKAYEVGPLSLELPHLVRWLKDRFGNATN